VHLFPILETQTEQKILSKKNILIFKKESKHRVASSPSSPSHLKKKIDPYSKNKERV
jgi:hypothetical protein